MISESRDDVLNALSLADLLKIKISEDFIIRNSHLLKPPPFFLIIISIIICLILYVLSFYWIAIPCSILVFAFVLLTVKRKYSQEAVSVKEKIVDISEGRIPSELYPLVLSRLRWWNHLITPEQWISKERIQDRQARLKYSTESLKKQLLDGQVDNIVNEKNAKEESDKDATYFSDIKEITALANKINTSLERKKYQDNLNFIENDKERKNTELLFNEAVLYKTKELLDKLLILEEANNIFNNYQSKEVASILPEALKLLEDKRLLIMQIDKIDMDDFLDLITL